MGIYARLQEGFSERVLGNVGPKLVRLNPADYAAAVEMIPTEWRFVDDQQRVVVSFITGYRPIVADRSLGDGQIEFDMEEPESVRPLD